MSSSRQIGTFPTYARSMFSRERSPDVRPRRGITRKRKRLRFRASHRRYRRRRRRHAERDNARRDTTKGRETRFTFVVLMDDAYKAPERRNNSRIAVLLFTLRHMSYACAHVVRESNRSATNRNGRSEAPASVRRCTKRGPSAIPVLSAFDTHRRPVRQRDRPTDLSRCSSSGTPMPAVLAMRYVTMPLYPPSTPPDICDTWYISSFA